MLRYASERCESSRPLAILRSKPQPSVFPGTLADRGISVAL